MEFSVNVVQKSGGLGIKHWLENGTTHDHACKRKYIYDVSQVTLESLGTESTLCNNGEKQRVYNLCLCNRQSFAESERNCFPDVRKEVIQICV